ncbi:aspartate transcarbamylase [Reticulomyxa filosa]|uniref:aspartate carbamoyltransferase n=1 Tax=Reticulomyxa filosa TaxID=46433 RepID=X6LXE7_RETFI|nr:aspartate transcarbamylase [Reticulomyxa filosa]|eukprot:ETO06299.1 aspartate transcarbamylase [Reticulomyxa filosa]
MASSETTSSHYLLPFLLFSGFVAGACATSLYDKHNEKKSAKRSAGIKALTTKRAQEWKNRALLSMEDISLEDIELVLECASEMKERVLNEDESLLTIAPNKILGCIFYEPSTRTCSSFQAAMQRLGGKLISITDVQSSSVSKGETLDDTIRCLAQYCDAVCIRHPTKGAAKQAAIAAQVSKGGGKKKKEEFFLKKDNVPVINAGDGSGEHPTQVLLDLFTMFEYNERHRIDNLTMTFIDLKYRRTAHSLVPALFKFRNIKVHLVSPKFLAFPDELKNKLIEDERIKKHNNTIIESKEITQTILQTTDVMYVTRIQKERFSDSSVYEKFKGVYVIDNSLLNKCKPTMILMHPLPRVDEIATECDDNPRSKYFQQMKCGMYVRMALLALILGNH